MSAILAQSGADAARTPGTQRATPAEFAHTSALYCGHIGHARFGNVAHQFRYRLFMTAVNLDELARPEGLGLGRLLDPNRRLSLFRMRRKDHLGDAHVPLKDAVLQRVSAALAGFKPGPVLLLTHLGQFGFRFNPVSFYFCFAPTDPASEQAPRAADALSAPLSAIVLEVSNTPWGEQHSYVLDCRNSAGPYKFVLPKTFTVSPFLPLDMEYRFRFELGRDQISIHKENWRGSERVFHAGLQLKRSALTNTALLGALARYPFMTWKVIVTIYYQALRLWLKGVPFLGHGGAPSSSSDSNALSAEQCKSEQDAFVHDSLTQDRSMHDNVTPALVNAKVKMEVKMKMKENKEDE